MKPMRPDPEIRVRKLRIPTPGGSIPALLLSPKGAVSEATGILWLHGGGYFAGSKEMVHASRAVDLVKQFGVVVLAPGYRLSLFAPYPAALEDGYASLLYLKEHAAALGVRSDQLMVGGESAGGGLCAAVCLRARDEGTVRVAFQMPLYPMLDDRDTESSRDNHGRVWNTRRNHLAWKLYLRGTDRVSPYAAPARAEDLADLPPAYSFVGGRRALLCRDGPVFCEAACRRGPGGAGCLPHGHARLRHDGPGRRPEPSGGGTFRQHFAAAQQRFFAPQRERGEL